MDIEASILECLLIEGASLNKISIYSNLNRKAAKAHLGRMVSDGLAKIVAGAKEHMVYSATEKGILWLKRYKSLADEGGFRRRRRESRFDRDF
jgi:predicted transcriptional regulator